MVRAEYLRKWLWPEQKYLRKWACLFHPIAHYDANVHEALAWFHMLDDSSFFEKAGQSVDFLYSERFAKMLVQKN